MAFNCTTDDECSFVNCGGDADIDLAACNDFGQCYCAKRASFFIGVGVYLGLLVFIAIYSYGQATGKEAFLAATPSRPTSPAAIRVVNEAVRLKDHFMASGSFGSVVMALTIFSTAFSGYTVVGVPEESSIQGFISMRWLNIGVAVNIGCMVFYPRLRRVGVTRNYNAPTDLLVDRFNSNRLRLLASLVLVIPLFIYTTVQFKAMGDIVHGLSLGRIPKYYAVSILCVIIIFCEIVGGQRSVTLSDAIQAVIMLTAFLIMPFVVASKYGFLSEIVEEGCSESRYNPNTQALEGCLAYSRPWATRTPTVFGSCDYDNRFTDPNCFASQYPGAVNNSDLPYLNEEFVGRVVIDPDSRTPFQHTTLSLSMFVFNAMAFPLNPHVMQKVFVARSDEVLKRSLMMVAIGAIVVNLPSIYYGVVKASKLNNETASAFPAVTGSLINTGGFAEFIGVVASCSALAAIMSTADSCIIGANNVITVDWVKNFLWKSASHKAIERVSMLFTPIFAVAAMIFSFHTENINFGTLLNLQNSFVWQVVPAYYVACYSDRVAAHPLFYGLIAGLITCLSLEVSVALQGVDTSHYGEDYYRFTVDTALPSGLWGIIVNICVVASTQILLEKTGSPSARDDTRTTDTVDTNVMNEFGHTRLTAAFINSDIMDKTKAPLETRRNRFIVYGILFVFFISLPWYESPYTNASVVGGFPRWAGGMFAAYFIEMALVTYVMYQWKPDPFAGLSRIQDQLDNTVSDFGEDDDTIDKKQIGINGGLAFDVSSHQNRDITDGASLIDGQSEA